MDAWGNFYFLVGSAAAGLTGLIFIAITFGSRLITQDRLPFVEAFFSPICYHFIHVFLLCAVAMIPGAEPRALAVTIGLTILWRVIQLEHTWRLTRAAWRSSSDIETSDWVLGIILPAIAYGSFVVTAVCYWQESPIANTLFAISLLCLLVIGLRRAWEMLLWIATKVD